MVDPLPRPLGEAVTAPAESVDGNEAVVAAGDEALSIARGGGRRRMAPPWTATDSRRRAVDKPHAAVAERKGRRLAEEGGVDDEGAEGKVLDGRHRYRASGEARLEAGLEHRRRRACGR